MCEYYTTDQENSFHIILPSQDFGNKNPHHLHTHRRCFIHTLIVQLHLFIYRLYCNKTTSFIDEINVCVCVFQSINNNFVIKWPVNDLTRALNVVFQFVHACMKLLWNTDSRFLLINILIYCWFILEERNEAERESYRRFVYMK